MFILFKTLNAVCAKKGYDFNKIITPNISLLYFCY